MSNLKLKIYLYALLFIASISFTGVADAERSLILAVHPYLPATELVKRYTPLTDYLGRKLNQPVKIQISKDYQDHIDKIGGDKVDIAYMGPASYVKVTALYGKKPILARLEIKGKPAFQGIIIAGKDSPLNNLKDLEGRRFAFGDPNSTMSHLVPRYMLIKEGVGIDKLAAHAFLENHQNVALGVLAGDYDAGAVKEAVFYKYEKRGLKALMKTPKISEHLFITRKNLPAGKVELLRKALFDLKEDERGRIIMASIKSSMTGMVHASDEDYNNLRIILQTLEKTGIKP
jgi:phosphonate transport system substrate-binding protein